MEPITIGRLLNTGYDFRKTRRDLHTGLFCVETNHYDSISRVDHLKYTYSLVGIDFGYPDREQMFFYLVETHPIPTNINGLMGEISDTINLGIRRLRRLDIPRLAVFNGIAPDYGFREADPSRVILYGGFTDKNCRPQPEERVDEVINRLGLPLVPEEEFLKRLRGEDCVPYEAMYI